MKNKKTTQPVLFLLYFLCIMLLIAIYIFLMNKLVSLVNYSSSGNLWKIENGSSPEKVGTIGIANPWHKETFFDLEVMSQEILDSCSLYYRINDQNVLIIYMKGSVSFESDEEKILTFLRSLSESVSFTSCRAAQEALQDSISSFSLAELIPQHNAEKAALDEKLSHMIEEFYNKHGLFATANIETGFHSMSLWKK